MRNIRLYTDYSGGNKNLFKKIIKTKLKKIIKYMISNMETY